ncbi:hypothetical protein IAR50_004857 [Cryptococcus sp. DSM 104548]
MVALYTERIWTETEPSKFEAENRILLESVELTLLPDNDDIFQGGSFAPGATAAAYIVTTADFDANQRTLYRARHSYFLEATDGWLQTTFEDKNVEALRNEEESIVEKAMDDDERPEYEMIQVLSVTFDQFKDLEASVREKSSEAE